MLLSIKDKIKNNETLVSNFFSLLTLQVANFILPLLAVPYLLHVLGVEFYGLLAFATALIMYFIILSDYGFNLIGTNDISINRESKSKVSDIFSAILIIKFFLILVGLLILTIIVFLFDKLSEHWEVYYLTFGIVIGQALFPIWFFQGIEKMKYISILNILAKSIFLIAIFIFVNTPEDYYLVPLFNALGFITAGIISLYYVHTKFGVSFRWQKKAYLLHYLKTGWHIFISRIAVVFYTSSNILVLGVFTDNVTVGYYAIAEKVIGAISSLGAMVNQVFFPYLSKIHKTSKIEYYKKFTDIIKAIIVLMFVVSITLYFLAPWIVEVLAGKKIDETIVVLQILAITVIFFPLGGFFTQSFVTQNANFLITKATFYTSLFNLFLVFPLVYFYDIYGLAVTVIAVQIFQIFININYFNKLKRNALCVE